VVLQKARLRAREQVQGCSKSFSFSGFAGLGKALRNSDMNQARKPFPPSCYA
jgi:hypothetical protein